MGSKSKWTGFFGLFKSGTQMISLCTFFLQQNIESVKTLCFLIVCTYANMRIDKRFV